MKDYKYQGIKLLMIRGRIILRYFCIFLIVFSISSCGGRDSIRPESSVEYTPGFKASSESEKGNALLLEQAMNVSLNGNYILGSEDLIEIDVFQVDELKRTVRVSSSGFINLPLTGKIKVSGLTVPELEEEISTRLQRYLQEPVVSVFIKEYRSQRITVLGAVKSPQVYMVTRQKFLLDMLSMAGGLTEGAGDICYVRRGSETIIVNINELLIEGNAKLNIPVFSGDIIHVSRGGVVFVNGAVNGPGSFVMKGTVTLTQAIAMAKGFRYEAKRDRLRLYRNAGKSTMEIIDVDYDAILAEEYSDIVLKDKDVVIVPKSGVKNFFSGFVNTFRGLIQFGENVSVGAGY